MHGFFQPYREPHRSLVPLRFAWVLMIRFDVLIELPMDTLKGSTPLPAPPQKSLILFTVPELRCKVVGGKATRHP